MLQAFHCHNSVTNRNVCILPCRNSLLPIIGFCHGPKNQLGSKCHVSGAEEDSLVRRKRHHDFIEATTDLTQVQSLLQLGKVMHLLCVHR